MRVNWVFTYYTPIYLDHSLNALDLHCSQSVEGQEVHILKAIAGIFCMVDIQQLIQVLQFQRIRVSRSIPGSLCGSQTSVWTTLTGLV